MERSTGGDVTAIEKFRQRMHDVNSMLCVGLDTDAAHLPARFGGDVFAFNRWLIDETAEFAAAFKPNTAHYEARGSTGWHDLEGTIRYLREQHPSVFTICDAKRGDIDSTSEQYAAAIFDRLGFDAVTLHPYTGAEALRPFLERTDRASIILCRTSNPGAGELQDLRVDGTPLWEIIAERAARHWNTHGNMMLVVGATYPSELRRVRERVGDMPLLIPGIGTQGGSVDSVIEAGLAADGGGLLLNASRSIATSDDPAGAARTLRDAIRDAQRRFRTRVNEG
jgi:orotidine-5'-phosphate decarboxylase